MATLNVGSSFRNERRLVGFGGRARGLPNAYFLRLNGLGDCSENGVGGGRNVCGTSAACAPG